MANEKRPHTVVLLGDTTLEGNHHYGWYLDENGNRIDFDEYLPINPETGLP